MAGASGGCAGRPLLALFGLRGASRELAFGVRELRRVRHLALARAGYLRSGPAAGGAGGAGVRGKHNEIDGKQRRGRNMFETTLAGSLPKPSWLRTPNPAWARGTLSGQPLFEAKDDATLLAIRRQEEAGIDIVSDGEQARQHFV